MKDDTSQQETQPADPTRAQLEILQVLWNHGPSTVRFVNDRLSQQKEAVSYTSTLKLMQIMHEKGMLLRDESAMTHIYSSILNEQRTKKAVLNKLVDSMYNGSVKGLMLELLGHDNTTSKDWEEIKQLLNKMKD
jgi:BlaI family transcriptional regulator, penicillinase repressor